MNLTDDLLKEFGKTLTAAEWRAVERHADGRASRLSWAVIKRFMADLEQLRTKKAGELEQVGTKKAGDLNELECKKGDALNELERKKGQSSVNFGAKRADLQQPATKKRPSSRKFALKRGDTP
jgi:hypothetical protein